MGHLRPGERNLSESLYIYLGVNGSGVEISMTKNYTNLLQRRTLS